MAQGKGRRLWLRRDLEDKARERREADDLRAAMTAMDAHDREHAQLAMAALRRELREELFGPASFVPVFLLVLGIVIATPLINDTAPGQIVLVLTTLGTLVLTIHRAGVTRTAFRFIVTAGILTAVLSICASLGASASGSKEPVMVSIASALFVMLMCMTLPAILRRVLLSRRVTLTILSGAMAAYLMLGLLFTGVYRFISATSSTPFFAQVDDVNSADLEYFSFITITTVGYGDLSPASNAARAGAVTEAIVGQIFLVTIVARVVSNLGTTKELTMAPAIPGETPSGTPRSDDEPGQPRDTLDP